MLKTCRQHRASLPPLTTGARREGLAPLELVLVLPLLVAIMCLMINIGIETKWKIRALEASRQAVWRTRGDRRGATDPPLTGWPASATLAVMPVANPPLFPQDPFAPHAVVRGPVLRDPQSSDPESQLIVDTRMLNLSGSLDMGLASINRQFPVFPQIGRVNLRATQLLLDSEWQFRDMGYGNNISRRIFWLYQFTAPQQVQELALAYQQAAMKVHIQLSQSQVLAPLDNDDEFIAYYGSAPDFHPVINNGCTLNRFQAYPDQQDLITRIQGPRGGGRGGVPDRMASAFIRMYQSQINDLNQQAPPPQAQIDQIQAKIDQLQRFRGSLN